MTQVILAIISGVIGITGVILKIYYSKKSKEPFNRRKEINNVFKKRKKEIESRLANGDYAGIGVSLDQLSSDVDRMLKKIGRKIPK